jgi:hypothetical protein
MGLIVRFLEVILRYTILLELCLALTAKLFFERVLPLRQRGLHQVKLGN